MGIYFVVNYGSVQLYLNIYIVESIWDPNVLSVSVD